MEIVMKKVKDLKPYENNPRNNEEAVAFVANSINDFGFKVPIVIDTENVIVAGHTRHKAAEQLGLTEVPCIIADDLTEEEIKEFRLADNKVAELSGWNWAKLEVELQTLNPEKMEQFGFTKLQELDIDSMFAEAEPKEKEPVTHTAVCPCCGETIIITDKFEVLP